MMNNLIRKGLAVTGLLTNKDLPMRKLAPTVIGQRFSSSDSSAYDGDGKTTIKVLNNEESEVHLVNTYSHKGFRLSNQLFITGSIILFPTNVFAWNVRRGANITMESLLLFDLIVPKVKIVVIGYGQHGEPYDASLPMKLKNKGISCELLPTPHAVTTYNYLVSDAVHVAGAFVPVKGELEARQEDIEAIYSYNNWYNTSSILPEKGWYQRTEGFNQERQKISDQGSDPNKKTFDP